MALAIKRSDMETEAEQRECLNKFEDGEKRGVSVIETPKTFWDGITLEPMWFGVTISLTMGIIAGKSLVLQRACLVDLGYSKDTCFNSQGINKSSIELETQTIISHLSIASGFIEGIITSILIMFLGPWSDSSGRRKPLILMPVIGALVATLCLLIIQACPKVSAIWVVYLQMLPLAVGGNLQILMIYGLSYLGDICYKTGRCATTVMGWNYASIFSCMVIGSYIGPIIFGSIGFVGFFSISICLELASLAYIIWWVKDVNVVEKTPSILDYTLPWQALQCVFKKRDGRKIVFLMNIVPCTYSLIMMNDVSITYLYVRNALDWTDVEFGTLLGVRFIILALGTIFIVKVLKQKLKLRDETIGFIGAVSQLFTCVSFMFSYNTWMIYAWKVSCVTAVFEKLTLFISIPLSYYIYNQTLSTFPSSFMIMSIVAAAVQIVCYSCVDQVGPQRRNIKERRSK